MRRIYRYQHGWGANIIFPNAPHSCSTVYHGTWYMVCNRTASVSMSPVPIVRTSRDSNGQGSCSYHITWQHPSACADLVEDPKRPRPVPYPAEKYKCDASMCTVAAFGGTLTKEECQATCVADAYRCVKGACQKAAAAGVPKATCEAACGPTWVKAG